ncbi:PAS domain S-box protein [Chamaesiphon sp.]|uniref:PAS domain-containing sensor histidine kinase n=1 Tax=Chamaesiphon sp. TaxID=2814140 RepID=UPI003592FE72
MLINPSQARNSANGRERKLLERIPQLAWLMTDGGDVCAVNRRWCEYIGEFGDDRLLLSFAEVLDVGAVEEWADAWRLAQQSWQPLAIKLQLKSSVGDWEWFRVELEPDRNEFGQTVWIGTAIRLGGEAALTNSKLSAQFLEALLVHASDAIVACDAYGRLVLFNRMAQSFHGLPPEPIDPAAWANYYDLYDGDGIETLSQSQIPLFRALQGESVVGQDMTIKSKLGFTRSLRANATPIYSPAGEQLGAVALMRDITAYKQATFALQQSERKFRAIFDGTFGLIGLLEPDGIIVEINQTAIAFAGLAGQEWIGSPFWAAPCWTYDRAIQEQLQQAIARAAQGEFVRYEVTLFGTGDRLVPIDFSLTPIRNDLGAVSLIIAEGRDLSQIEQAQTEQRQAQLYNERLSAAMKLAKAGAWHLDLGNQTVHWTPEFEILLDYEPGSTQQLYQEWLDRVHPDDRVQTEANLQAAIDGAAPEYHCEYRIICRNGQIRWMETIGELHTDAQGHLNCLSGLIYDITDRKHQEEALRRSEEFTRRVLESNQDCIKVLDLDGRLLYMNDGGQVLMEIDDFTAVAKAQWRSFWQGSEAEAAQAAFRAALAGGVGTFDGYCATAKGTPKWWDVVVTPILDADGRVAQILSVSRDITERKQAETALHKSEELFRYTFEHTAIGFCHVALDGTWLRVNQKLCNILGYSAAELLATTFQAITEPADLDADLALVAQLVNGDISEYHLEKRYIHKQGHQIWVDLNVALLRESNNGEPIGTPRYFISSVADITERKQLALLNQKQTADLQQLNDSLMLAQQQLKDRNEELDRFGYIVSHDLKAPLRSIANLSEWIEEDLGARLLDDERQQFQILRQRVKRMDALVDGLLRYSRLGRKDVAIETVDVGQLLAETIDSLAPPASFQIEIHPMPTFDTKQILLSQVFANLLSNALKHHERLDGRVEIAAEDLGDRYQFSIADDGPGVPFGEARERIFDMFQTLKPSSSSENTGIGLALVKKIVEGEGGRIWLDDKSDRGACFRFTWLKSGL